MTLYLTSIFAVLIGMVYVVQTFAVIQKRRAHGIVHGDGANKSMLKRIRGHGNSAEQVPLFLILMTLLEAQSLAGPAFLAIVASVFLAGRIAHGLYFLDIGLTHHFRQFGMLATMLGQILFLIALARGISQVLA